MTPEDDRNYLCAFPERHEELFGDELLTQRVLEGQIEAVPPCSDSCQILDIYGDRNPRRCRRQCTFGVPLRTSLFGFHTCTSCRIYSRTKRLTLSSWRQLLCSFLGLWSDVGPVFRQAKKCRSQYGKSLSS